MLANFFKDRKNVILIAFSVFVFACILRLISLQVVNGEDYLTQSKNRLMSSMSIPAPRGEIADRYGRPFVTNKTGFSVEIQKSNISTNELNNIIYNLLVLMDAEGEKYTDSLPISDKPYQYTFDESDSKKDKIADFLETEKLSDNISADKAIAELKDKYDITENYGDYLRKVIGVRYEMSLRGFSVNTPYTLCTDVGVSTITKIKEQGEIFKGVSISTVPIRQYSGNLAAHLLGRVGIIYKEEYEELKDENYGMNDIIGKDGMEKYLEKYIRGKDGVNSVIQTIDGKTSSISNATPATPGNNAILTLDMDVQRVAEKSLEENILKIRAQGMDSTDKRGASAGGGAVVAIDVNTGETIAMASYPTYNPATFDEDYSKLYNNRQKPMFNRAISGTYPPGSVFKMVTAVAGMEEKAVKPGEIIEDKGVYKYYNQSFNCWVWSDQGRTHGRVNISQAIMHSCNYYFYEIGKRMGIDKLYKYGKNFGLGEYTGIELEGESKGVLANKKYKEKTFDEEWYPGDTVQAAIGQSYNLFTPVQIANYIATFANGGTRYKVHLLKEVREHSTGRVILKNEPEALSKIDISPETYEAVREGMYLTSIEGTASNVFKDYPVAVCSKTGSAQVSTGVANGVFVAYAPYDNPQIAVAVVVENAGSGNAIAPVARDIFDQYFGINSYIPANSGKNYYGFNQ